MKGKPFWTIGTDEDGSLRISEPGDVWIINFGDLGNLDLVEVKVLGGWLKDWAWQVGVPQLLEDYRTVRASYDKLSAEVVHMVVDPAAPKKLDE